MSTIKTTNITHGSNSGTANMVLASDGNVTVAGALAAGSFTGAGLFTSYAIICDEKDSTTNAGGFSTDAWRTRDLNTEIADPDGIVSISSNQFTLQAGSYLIKWDAPVYSVDRYTSILYDVTNSAIKQYGRSGFDNNYAVQTATVGIARVTITGATAYEIQCACQTSQSSNGFGYANEIKADGDYSNGTTEGKSIYTIVEIYKEA
jgi:hypothetical protein